MVKAKGTRSLRLRTVYCVLAGRKDGVEGSECGSPCGYKSFKNIKSKQMCSVIMCTSARILCCISDDIIWLRRGQVFKDRPVLCNLQGRGCIVNLCNFEFVKIDTAD